MTLIPVHNDPDGEQDCNLRLHDPPHDGLMAWFRPMGVDEVAYHQKTVVGRADDYPGAALDYYGSRGETPLRWGGAGAARLGLHGEVTPEVYEAAFGPGGFVDPTTGRRSAATKRPGFELVVSAHKSVAVLGVIDQADNMHSILALHDLTLDWTVAQHQHWITEGSSVVTLSTTAARAFHWAGTRIVT